MNAEQKKQLLTFLTSLVEALGKALGPNCEIVLHDFDHPESSIIAIANGHITGRKVGDTLDVLGFQLLRQGPTSDLFNYRTTTKTGKVLRSSSIFLRDESGEIFGSICINYDISGLLNLQEWINRELQTSDVVLDEKFEHTVEEVLEALVQSALAATGKPISDLTREEKIGVIAHLESKGAFLIRYSVDRVAELLNLSKYTIYNYLDEIKARRSRSETTASRTTRKNSVSSAETGT
ncbi:MAG TPA: helix-turn-helix transcriptional regulator [Blastocatellia bacterium]|nr:helix-turn-helix transcriptional regulator [Blastocatellia bacterium]